MKDSFSFAKKIVEQNSTLHMVILDVDSFFTIALLQETFDFLGMRYLYSLLKFVCKACDLKSDWKSCVDVRWPCVVFI